MTRTAGALQAARLLGMLRANAVMSASTRHRAKGIITFCPTSMLVSVDLPALGTPITATCVCCGPSKPSSASQEHPHADCSTYMHPILERWALQYS